eukprot:4778550-Amphidinium_carterae.1
MCIPGFSVSRVCLFLFLGVLTEGTSILVPPANKSSKKRGDVSALGSDPWKLFLFTTAYISVGSVFAKSGK